MQESLFVGTSPHIFLNIDLSETVRVEVEGTTTLLFIPQIFTTNKTGNPYNMLTVVI